MAEAAPARKEEQLTPEQALNQYRYQDVEVMELRD